MSESVVAYLESPRLRFRRLCHDDAEALCAYRSLPSVGRFQYWDSFGPKEAFQLIESQLGAEPDVPGTWFQLAIVSAATGHVIGDCGLHCQKNDPRSGIRFYRRSKQISDRALQTRWFTSGSPLCGTPLVQRPMV